MSKRQALEVEVESVAGLTEDEASAVRCAARPCGSTAADLDSYEAALRSQFPGWFVYRGGKHVALHRTRAWSGKRLILAVMR